MKLPIVLVPILAAMTLAAQTPAPAQDQTSAHRSKANARARRGMMLQRLTARFHLTPEQQNQARVIFKDSREQSKSLAAKLREERTALHAAVKSDAEQQIDQITQQDSATHAQIEAIRLKAMAKFYGILTPDQKAKFDTPRAHRAA
jgi:Spy/CpxP family protein refolding chaperone